MVWPDDFAHRCARHERFKNDHERICRLQKNQGLSMRYNQSKRNKAPTVASLRDVGKPDQSDVSHGLCGQPPVWWTSKLCVRSIADCRYRANVAVHARQSSKGGDVVSVLSMVVTKPGKPQTIKSDSSNEFIIKSMDKCGYQHRVNLDSYWSDKPTGNAVARSFSSGLRQKFLNDCWSVSLQDAR